MSLLYGEVSLVADFKVRSDIITMRANQTFTALLTAFTICLWINTSPGRQGSMQKALFSYLPDREGFDGIQLSLIPNYILFNINNDLLTTMAKVSKKYL